MKREEALREVRGFIEQLTEGCQDAIRTLVPELRESEDERIRKEIIEHFLPHKNELLVKRWIAYLEKQKEQKSRIDACGFPLREEGESACSYLERCLAPDMRNIWYEACSEIKEKQKEQKPDDIKREWWNKGYLEGRKNAHIPARELGLPSSLDFQQQPAEWSEEDESQRSITISFLTTFAGMTDRLNDDGLISSPALQGCVDWLKSLRPQPQWKPSEEQMKALETTAHISNFGRDADRRNALLSLCNDLKKL